MDFGFGAFLEKFEEYFGRLATRLLLTLIGLAVVSVTGSIIWKTLLAPLVNLALPAFAALDSWSAIIGLGWQAIIVGGGIAAGYTFASGIANTLLTVRLAKKLDQVERLLDSSEKTYERSRLALVDTKARLTETEDTLNAAKLTLDHGITRSLESGMLTIEQAELIRELVVRSKGEDENHL